MVGPQKSQHGRRGEGEIEVLAVSDRCGEADGGVLRIFLLGASPEFSGGHVANIVKVALGEAKKAGRRIQSIVLPAGAGGLGVVGATTKGRFLRRSVIEPIARTWVKAFQGQIGRLDADVVVGLDGGATREGWYGAPYSIQTAVLFKGDEFHLTFKCMPANSSERTWLVSPSEVLDSPLVRHCPFARNGKVMLQVCHDGLLCSGRGAQNSRRGSWAWMVRKELGPKLRSGMVAYNPIHQLPRTWRSESATSSSFQDSHDVMRERGLDVVAVSGIPRSPRRGDHFRQLSERLACTVPHVDVLIDA